MKKIALVGGLGPEGTVDYYRTIIAAFKADYDALGNPEIVIESLNLKALLALATAERWDELGQIIAARFESMRIAGADFGAIAANTPHKAFDTIQAATSLPLMSIVTATCDAVRQRGLDKVALLGTAFTMQSDFFLDEFAAAGIELVVPELDDQEFMHEKLFSEIEHGIVEPNTKRRYIQIAQDLIQDRAAQGVISACTEFPLVMQAEDFEVDFFDAGAIHVARIVEQAKA